MKKKTIEVTTKMTEENYLAFNRTHYRFMMRRKKWWFFLFLFLSIPLIFLYFTSPIGKDYFWGTFFLILDCLIITETMTTLLPDLFTRRMLRHHEKQIKTENHYQFHDAYFIVMNKSEEVKVFYQALKQVIEVENYFYLYKEKGMAYVIDKRDLTDTSIITIRSMIKEHVKKYYQRKR